MLQNKAGRLGYGSLFALAAGIFVAMPATAQTTSPPPSAAATPPPAEATTQVVIVYARRTAEDVQKVPEAVSAYSATKVDQLVFNTTEDLNKLSPGLQVQPCSSSRNCSQPSIRGQGTAFGTGQSSVIDYFDDVPNFGVGGALSPGNAQASTLDLSSLQVVKGPQGTLFGATATGGVLLFQPVRPTRNDFNGYIQGEVGTYNFTDLEGALGGAIIPDVLQWRLSGKERDRGGFTTAFQSWGGSTKVDDTHDSELRFQLTFRPTRYLENDFLYAAQYTWNHGTSSPVGYIDTAFISPIFAGILNSHPGAGGLVSPSTWTFQTGAPPPSPAATWQSLLTSAMAMQLAAGPRTTFYNYDHRNAQFFQGVIDQAKWDITPDITLRNIFGLHLEQDKGPAIDVDGTNLPMVDTRAFVLPTSTNLYTPQYAWSGGWPSRTITDEIQLQGKSFENRLNWQAGVFYNDQGQRAWEPFGNAVITTFEINASDPVNGALLALAGGMPCVPGTAGASQCLSTLQTSWEHDEAVYGQAAYAILDNLHFTAGIRHSWSDTSTSSALTPTDFVTFEGVPQAIPSVGRSPIPGTETTLTVPAEQQNTYTFALDWQVNNNLLAYVTTRTGYKPGGINGNAPLGNPNRTFGPEDLTDWEGGLKSTFTFMGVTGLADVAVFRDNYTNIQTSSIIPGTATTITINAAAAIIQGVEFDGALHFDKWFDLSGWFSYLDAHYTSFVQATPCNLTSDYWYTQCASILPPPFGTPTELFVNNANGTVTIAQVDAKGVPLPGPPIATFPGQPAPLGQTAKYTFSIQPTLHLDPWLNQRVSISANIRYTSGFGTTNAYPGVALTPVPAGSVLASPFYLPAHVVTDLRADWNNPFGSKATVSLVVTNVTNDLYVLGNASGFTIDGSSVNIYSEPRMFYLELRVPIGAGS